MIGRYARELTVLPSMCDGEGLLGVPNAFALFMDIATEHAEALHIGMNDLMPRGLFWLTVRTKLRFYRRPRLTERVVAATWPETPERSRCNRDYLLTAGEETLVEGRTEWMIMNLRTNRLHPADGIFPEGLTLDHARVLPGPYMHMDEAFDGAEEMGTYIVRSTDIDLGGHMNNAAYVRAIAGAFSSKDWQAMNIREMEVAFRSPCFEGETLEIQRRTTDAGTDVRLSRDGKTIVLARII